jgi:hypothetical protein
MEAYSEFPAPPKENKCRPWMWFAFVMLLLFAAAAGLCIYFGYEAYGNKGMPCRCNVNELVVCENDKLSCRNVRNICGPVPDGFCPEGQAICVPNRPLSNRGVWKCAVSPQSAKNYFQRQVCGRKPRCDQDENLICVMDASGRGGWQCAPKPSRPEKKEE